MTTFASGCIVGYAGIAAAFPVFSDFMLSATDEEPILVAVVVLSVKPAACSFFVSFVVPSLPL